jgi:hypothetical protein
VTRLVDVSEDAELGQPIPARAQAESTLMTAAQYFSPAKPREGFTSQRARRQLGQSPGDGGRSPAREDKNDHLAIPLALVG